MIARLLFGAGDGGPHQRGTALVAFARLVARRFFAQGMAVYAAALAYRGLLALVPFALLALSLIGLFGIDGSLPRLTILLLRLRGRRGHDSATTDVPLEGLLSLGAMVGLWSMATGARLFMRALNAAHGVEETRTPLARAVKSAVFLPALASLTVAATVLLLLTSRVLAGIAGWAGLGPVLDFLGSWIRMPLALAVIAAAVAAAYRYGPSVKPPLRALLAGAGVAVALWAVTSFAFGFALSTVLDYGATYGGLGAAVALLVYLHLSAIVLLLGAQVSAVWTRAHRARGRGAPEHDERRITRRTAPAAPRPVGSPPPPRTRRSTLRDRSPPGWLRQGVHDRASLPTAMRHLDGRASSIAVLRRRP